MLLVAGTAAAVQAFSILGSLAWLSRVLPVEAVGKFGLYLALLNFALALDGVRHVSVVAGSSPSDGTVENLAEIANYSWLLGCSVAIVVSLLGSIVLKLGWAECAPISIASFLLLANSPGLARLDSAGLPHLSSALHSGSWSLALGVGTLVAWLVADVTIAAWALILAPVSAGAVLFVTGYAVFPSFRWSGAFARVSLAGVRSTIATALAGVVDRVTISVVAGPAILGLYAPAAELVGRAGAVGGLVSNLFLNDETRTTQLSREHQELQPHRIAISIFFISSAILTVLLALEAETVLTVLVPKVSAAGVLAFRLLLAGLTINLGAQWSAMALRARGSFDLYRPYSLAVVAAIALGYPLVSRWGMVGGALVVLIIRVADAQLIFRARRELSWVQICSVAASFMLSLTLAASQFVQQGDAPR